MKTTCIICNNDFDVDDDLFLREDNPLDVNEEQICDECAEIVLEYWHNLRLN